MKTSVVALVAALGLAGGIASAQAADLGGDCCADLEERVAELEATTARKGNRKVSLTVSGFVNESVLFWDDGVERNTYQATNLVSQTRLRFLGSAKISADVSAGYLLEFGIAGARSDAVDATTDDPAGGNAISVRHSAWWLQSKQLGKLWVGQTSSATDGITEINLANITHFYTENAAGMVGAFQTRRRAGGAAGPLLRTFMGGNNTDSAQIGEGNRNNVVKYETPTFAGFSASAAWGEDDLWDVAARYAGEFSGFKIAAGIGYQQISGVNANERNCVVAAGSVDCSQLGASGAILHVPTGLFVHGVYGIRWDDNVAAGLDDSSTQWLVAAGIEQNFFGFGKTTIFGEYQSWEVGVTGNNVAALDMTAWGLGINQQIDAAAMDLYIHFRQYDPNSSARVDSDLHSFKQLTAGGIIRF